MDIQPASLDQIQKSASGRSYVVDADVGNVAKQLQEIDPSLRLVYHEATNHYTVNQVLPDGSEQLVTSALPVDGGVDARLVERVRKVCSPSYDLAGELQAHNDRVERERQRERDERSGEKIERAYHNLRKREQIQNRIYVP